MTEKHRLYNRQKFDIGIIIPDKPLGINIKPGSFTLVTDDDIDYLMSTCTLLQRGLLKTEDEKQKDIVEQMGVDTGKEAGFMTDEEICKKLNGTAKRLEEWLAGVNDPVALDRIADLAGKMDLAINKVKVLQHKIPNRNMMED